MLWIYCKTVNKHITQTVPVNVTLRSPLRDFLCLLSSPPGADCRHLSSVPAPDQHGADLPAAAAGDGHAEAAGRLRAAGGAAGEMRGRAEKGQGAGPRPGGLHRQSFTADHGADAHAAPSARQAQVTTASDCQFCHR